MSTQGGGARVGAGLLQDDRCLTEPGGGDGIHVDFLVAGALVTGPVGRGSRCHRALVAVATGHLVHALDHT